jgi:serine/threonine protein phosphatase PrpC
MPQPATMSFTVLDPAPQPIPLPAEPGKVRLALRVGCWTRSAHGKQNEDFYGIALPDDGTQAKGFVLALADGISASGLGRIASEATVRSLINDFYGTPAVWNTAHALEKLLCASNDWLAAQNARRPEVDGIVAAVSALVLQNNRYFLAHVGDTRVYRLRGPVFKQLTLDHTWPRQDMRHVLKRAVGLDTHLVVDFADGELKAGDTFLMVTDGVWDVLGEPRMKALLVTEADSHTAAKTLVDTAHTHQAAYMGRNDASAIVVQVLLVE